MRKRKTSARVQKRQERVFDLMMIEGHDEPVVMARLLLDEGTIESKSLESATRLVRSDVALIRDASEQQRYVERRLFALRRFRRIAEDESEVQFDVVTPKGETVTMSKPRWPAAIRVRALHHFGEEAEAIARIAAVDVTGKRKPKDNSKNGARYTGTVPIDLSALDEADRKAIAEAMQRHPGAGEDDGKGGGAPN